MARRQESGKLLCRAGTAKEVTLTALAAETAQQLELLGLLDTLSNQGEIEFSTKCNNRLDDRRVVIVNQDSVNELAIYLQAVDRKLFELNQG